MKLEQIGGDYLIIQIEQDSDIPIYTQLTNQIIEGIARGELQTGQSLPSVRAFAADLGVNMHTVNKSYHELEKKGIIQIVPKSGAVITNIDQMTEDIRNRIITNLKPHLAEALVMGMTKEEVQKLITTIMEKFQLK